MSERFLFPVLVGLGLLGLGGVALHARGAPARLRVEAAAAGRATAELSIREMG
ncbi:MAG TPA: hypothetical protein VF805_08540 [Anaeromyxobacteraceae bacterium]